MAKKKLSDKEAKKILLSWPTRTNSVWKPPGGNGFWIQAQPKTEKQSGPKLSSPGASLFKTQPDGMWLFFDGTDACDVVVVEVCGSIQNLNDKRSRYFPTGCSLVVNCSNKWLIEDVPTKNNGHAPRWKASGRIFAAPVADLSIPVRYLRVLYALPNDVYKNWCRDHIPTGYEYFCPHSSLDSYKSPKMQDFLKQMSIAGQFYTDPNKS